MKTYSSIELEGPDAWDFGHRMFSRNIKTLPLKQGRLTLFLSAEGKVQSIFWTIKKTQGLSLIVETPQQKTLYDLIERYHFSENFKTTMGPTISHSWKAAACGQSGFGELRESGFVGCWRQTEFCFGEAPPSAPSERMWTEHRIQHLIPEWGLDMNSSTLVFEPGLDELCDENKGCYIGQEVVERVRSRGGQSPRKLALFEWNDEPPAEAPIISGENQEAIGSSTQTRINNAKGKWQSLGYAKRGFGSAGISLICGSSSGHWVRSV